MSLQMYPASPLSGVKSIIAVAAGKGGVGKSTVTVNLALALQAAGFKVGIMDTDIYGPSVRKMLKEDQLPQQTDKLIIPALCKGIKYISMAFFRKDNEASVVRAPIATRFISQFIQNVDWGKLDFLLVDFPPGTGDVQLTLSQQLNLTGALMVTTPQEVAVLDVRKAMTMFEIVKVPIIGIVENMSFYQASPSSEPVYLFGRGGGEKLAHETGSSFLGSIPLDPELCQCGDKGTSLFSLDPNAQKPVTKAFVELAKSIAESVIHAGKQTLSIKAIQQKDAHAFTIVWNDGKEQDFRLSDLQRNCPCANCVDENTGRKLLDPNTVKEDVRAETIRNVGRYALQIQFTSGCSTGIYSYNHLRTMTKD